MIHLHEEQAKVENLAQALEQNWQQASEVWADKVRDDFAGQYVEPLQEQMRLFMQEFQVLIEIVDKLHRRMR